MLSTARVDKSEIAAVAAMIGDSKLQISNSGVTEDMESDPTRLKPYEAAPLSTRATAPP